MPAEVNISQLKWQCRRGMRELDELLQGWLERRYAVADDAAKSAFRALLELPDPELIGYLLGNVTPPSAELRDIVRRIRRAANSASK